MKNVAMIGLGIMGVPMARNLAKAGMALSVWNRSPDKAQTLVDEGATLCPDLVSLASGVSHIVIMVYGPEALLAIAEKLAKSDLTGKTIINTSTVSPQATLAANAYIETAGGVFLDAPVSGSVGPATAGELVFMVGGDKGSMEEATDLFDAMGKKTVHCGPVGSGTRMKLAIQMLLGNVLGGLSEAMVFANAAGLDLYDFMAVANNGAIACPMVAAKGGAIADQDFTPVSPMHQLGKDVGLAIDEANAKGLTLPQSSDLLALLTAAMQSGFIEQDVCAIYSHLQASQ
ncbi:NAD(P)-dependent oxidoreductase [Cohaesibacter celericrescens]|uniref:2-hydroxy-3-oxopropionate reductase n=1 Tax=Cohaesibacter celericrescens TaxID=2067669 RepID=A0A2N5XU11_9HYPH|nr:NAD(P)-dependent oxidoreductase [Cohaesibacter celericrescens]PLW77979.1 hypothetical protein C0081_06825 [Cohaesibacter celericrescens]